MYYNFTKGFLEGIAVLEDWKNFRDCLHVDEDALEDLNTGIQYFLEKDVIMGLASVGKSLHALPSAMENCQAGAKDVETLRKSFADINSTKAFVWRVFKNLMVAGMDVYNDVISINDNYEKGNFFMVGFNAGRTFTRIFLLEHEINRDLAEELSLLTIDQNFAGNIGNLPIGGGSSSNDFLA
mmetsp:Transcript_47989/g.55502  ORF Transcript_47989/g.55502 Transcript_47989/m.55502 type:complete len:182 (+) Transcript_47989:1-546(+)